ncbi:MAG: RimJ/RimL family protein N-acetyltransferase [Bradymonadia bacterium]|jgi:RimJ/RimL family protein N-acetyltransferase
MRPLRTVEAPDLAALLMRPDLQRRAFAPSLSERQPIDWSERRRTFGVFLDGRLTGGVELVADEDDPGTWELGLSLTEIGGVGGRCAAAALFYAFERLDAEMVWCWAGKSNVPIERLTRRFGFVSSHAIRQPDGRQAMVYELDVGRWDAERRGVMAHYLSGAPITICDEVSCWRGEQHGFRPDGAQHQVALPVQALEEPPELH